MTLRLGDQEIRPMTAKQALRKAKRLLGPNAGIQEVDSRYAYQTHQVGRWIGERQERWLDVVGFGRSWDAAVEGAADYRADIDSFLGFV